MKKHLVISTDCFLPRWDGIARFLKELMPYLVKEFQVTVLCPEFPGKMPDFPGVHIHCYPLLKIRFGDIYFAWVGYKSIEKQVERADIVFNQTIGPIGMAAIKAAHKKNIPVVSFVHSIEWELASRAVRHGKMLVEMFVKSIAKKKYNQCNLLITPSAGVSDILSANGIKTRKIVVPLGIDVRRFVPSASKPMSKKTIGIDPKKLVVGFCGRIGREKDLPTLLKAFRRLQRKHDAILLLVGSGLEDKAFRNPRIKRVGAVDDVIPYLQAMDVFVLPSLTETSSLATMEAMACGLPVIATPVGSIKEYIEDGINGFIFPRQDVNALTEKLNALLKNQKVRETIGVTARQTIAKRHDWEEVSKKILQILHELTK
ncbi:MAG: glycosyltransferase family 4 protein [Candidatus Woesearchaeota archaeon]